MRASGAVAAAAGRRRAGADRRARPRPPPPRCRRGPTRSCPPAALVGRGSAAPTPPPSLLTWRGSSGSGATSTQVTRLAHPACTCATAGPSAAGPSHAACAAAPAPTHPGVPNCVLPAAAGIDLDCVMKGVLHLARRHEVSIDSNYAALVIGVCVIGAPALMLVPAADRVDAQGGQMQPAAAGRCAWVHNAHVPSLRHRRRLPLPLCLHCSRVCHLAGPAC